MTQPAHRCLIVLADGEDHVSLVSSDRPVYGKILDIITDASGKTIAESLFQIRPTSRAL